MLFKFLRGVVAGSGSGEGIGGIGAAGLAGLCGDSVVVVVGLELQVFDLRANSSILVGGLVLDFSYRPMNIVCWKRAIGVKYMEKADVLECYDRAVNSLSGSFYIPAVLRVLYIHYICLDFGVKLEHCSWDKIVIAQDVLVDGRQASPKMEIVVITLMHLASYGLEVELEVVFMLCAIAAMEPSQRDLVKVSLDNLSTEMQYSSRSKYLGELMGHIIFP
ncbi:hypothetical protein Droror1_Dr00020194 [Drosera rotundifolia]